MGSPDAYTRTHIGEWSNFPLTWMCHIYIFSPGGHGTQSLGGLKGVCIIAKLAVNIVTHITSSSHGAVPHIWPIIRRGLKTSLTIGLASALA